MIVTPEQAVQMRCCSSPVNNPKSYGQCGADKCMGWRWALEAVEDDGVTRPVQTRTFGYCGIGGMPDA